MPVVFPAQDQTAWIIAQRPAREAALDPFRPQGFFVEDEPSASGPIVRSAVVLLTNKECPWRCLMCDLWKNTLTYSVPPGAIPAQIDFALKHIALSPHSSPPFPTRSSQSGECGRRGPQDHAPENLQQVKLYNSGSFFDAAAIPVADYSAIARRLSFADRVIVESHPRLIGEKVSRFRDLLRGSLEVAMGLETVHPEILPRLNKRFELEHFARAAEFLRQESIALRAFVLLRTPFMNEDDGIE